VTTPTPIDARLAALEQTLRALSAEVTALRAEVAGASTSASNDAAHAPASSASGAQESAPSRVARGRDRRRSAYTTRDLEGVLGRYGMLAIAVLAAVAAVGTFLSWAVTRGLFTLSPAVRVLAGLTFAAAIAIWGVRLRRTERSFGSSILGLALAIEQVCAYAASSAFHLVPSWVAFVGAAVASWALAVFAHGEEDEPLWCVGFGGAALAPFVTSDGRGSVYVLALYAAVVMLPACFAISHRNWPVGWRVFYLVAALFVGGVAELAHAGGTLAFTVALALPFVIAGAGIMPFAPAARKRGALRWLTLLAIAALLIAHSPHDVAWIVASLTGAALVAWLVLLDHTADVPTSSVLASARTRTELLDWIDAAFIPLMFSGYLLRVLELGVGTVHAALPGFALAIVIGAFAWRRAVGALRDAAAFASVLLAIGATFALPLEQPTGRIAFLSALGLAVLSLHRARPSRAWLGMGAACLALAALGSLGALLGRPSYQFTPFGTEPVGTAIIVTIALAIVARFWPTLRIATRISLGERQEWTYASQLRRIIRIAVLAPWLWTFLWVLVELSMSYSPSTSTLLLVTYFAATGVACVAVGRMRRSASLRQTGLGLAVIAAVTAFYGATTYFDFVARIEAYLVTSAFLLGIAYWYRRAGETESVSA
jgi:predicted membrane protein DUF2339